MSFYRMKSVPFAPSLGTVGYRVITPGINPGDAPAVGGRATTGVSELPAGTGNYWVTVEFPDTGGAILFDDGQAPATYAIDEVPKPIGFVHGGKAQGGTANMIQFQAADASLAVNRHRGQRVQIVAGTGKGQSRRIIGYSGSTGVGGTSFIATVDRNWDTNPDATSIYEVDAHDGPKLTDALESTPIPIDGLSFAGWGKWLLAWSSGLTNVTGAQVDFKAMDGVSTVGSLVYGNVKGVRATRTLYVT